MVAERRENDSFGQTSWLAGQNVTQKLPELTTRAVEYAQRAKGAPQVDEIQNPITTLRLGRILRHPAQASACPLVILVGTVDGLVLRPYSVELNSAKPKWAVDQAKS